MSFEPDNAFDSRIGKPFVDTNNQLLMALVIILSDAQDIDYNQLINDPELT